MFDMIAGYGCRALTLTDPQFDNKASLIVGKNQYKLFTKGNGFLIGCRKDDLKGVNALKNCSPCVAGK